MYDAAVALRDAMIALGLACDGGKDSLSMAASAGGEVGTSVNIAHCKRAALLHLSPQYLDTSNGFLRL